MSMQVDSMGGHSVAASASLARNWDRWFFTGMAAAAVVTVFLGFAPSYYLRGFSESPPLPALVHVHGILFTCWILLVLSQTTLIAAGRVDLHRRLGIFGGALALAMLVVGYLVAIAGARRGLSPDGRASPLMFLVVPLGNLVLFAVLVGSGLRFRRRRQTHKRLMLLATIALLTPALARMPFVGIGRPAMIGTSLFVVACMVYDRAAHGRVHPAFLWGGLLVILSMPVRLAIGRTEAWGSFARWLVG